PVLPEAPRQLGVDQLVGGNPGRRDPGRGPEAEQGRDEDEQAEDEQRRRRAEGAHRRILVEDAVVTKPLWAPWRLEYIQSADEQEGCIFCLAAAGEDEERLVVHRGTRGRVLLNKFPYASGHLMVAPLRHGVEFGELEDEEALEIHRLAREGLGALAETYAPQGYNLGWNLGRI